MTALYWLASKGTRSQYVKTTVKSVHELGEWTWHYVPANQNPSHLGNRGVSPSKLKGLWLKGPAWLADESCWREAPVLIETASCRRGPSKEEREITDGARYRSW